MFRTMLCFLPLSFQQYMFTLFCFSSTFLNCLQPLEHFLFLCEAVSRNTVKHEFIWTRGSAATKVPIQCEDLKLNIL